MKFDGKDLAESLFGRAARAAKCVGPIFGHYLRDFGCGSVDSVRIALKGPIFVCIREACKTATVL